MAIEQRLWWNTNPKCWLNKAMWVCAITSVGLSVLVTVTILTYPYGVNYGEAMMVDLAQRVLRGQSLYTASVQTPPYMFSNYPPLYPILTAAASKATHLPLYQAGRLISILAAIISSLVIKKLASYLTGSRHTGWLAAMLFLGHPYVTVWSSIARMDMAALAFGLLALWIIYRKWRSWLWLMLGILCLVCSVYTRQSYLLATPLAGCIWLWRNNRRRATIFTGIYILACLGLFGLLDLYTQGGFYFDVVRANVGIYSIERALSMASLFLIAWPIATIIAGYTIFQTTKEILRTQHMRQGTQNDKPRAEKISLEPPGSGIFLYGLLPYTLGALISTLTAGKEGSATNYFLELIVAMTLWIAIWWAKASSAVQPSNKKLVALLLVCQFTWGISITWTLSASPAVNAWRHKVWYDSIYQQVQNAEKQGSVLSDDRLDMVLLAGQPIYYEPFLYTQLYHAGLWDPSTFAEEIAAQKFPLILIGITIHKECCWPPAVIEAVEHNYEATQQRDILIYKPIPK